MLWEYIKNNMEKHPNQIICEDNAEMSYEEIIAFAESFGKRLKGIKCCAVFCSSEMAASLALLSCLSAEVTALPLSLRYGEIHCKNIIEFIEPDAVIVDNDGELQVIHIKETKFIEQKQKPALIMCTSGTTGVPKGVMLSEKNIETNVSDIVSYFKINDTDTILISRPLYHCAVLTGELLTSLIKGVKIRFYSGTFNPSLILQMLDEYKITCLCGTPTLLSMMARLKQKKGGSYLKHICVSGECMNAQTGSLITQTFPHAAIYHVYGLTEACPRVSYLPPELFDEYTDYVGIPLNSVSVKILSDDGKRVPFNQIGTVWVKGNSIMLGYYNDTKKTESVIKNRWLCTGDIGFLNEKGLLKIIGRKDDLIIKAGMNIYPQEVENRLKLDPRVKEAIISSEKSEKLGVQLILNISGEFECISEIKALCQKCLPPYQIPSKIYLHSELPKNGSGKIIRKSINYSQ